MVYMKVKRANTNIETTSKLWEKIPFFIMNSKINEKLGI